MSLDNEGNNGNLKYLESLNELYSSFENRVPLIKNGSEHLRLPHFNGNKNQPIHRWFTYKEGFSCDLLEWVLGICDINLGETERILDPFLGVGTSLLSAQMSYTGTQKLSLIGIERNPFTAFVARTKLNWAEYDLTKIEKLIPSIISKLSAGSVVQYPVPGLSTLQNEKVFDRKDIQDILFARELIKESTYNSEEIAFLKLGWSSIIETVSNVRKDGRALRFVSKDPRPSVAELVEAKWRQMLSDVIEAKERISQLKRGTVLTQVLEGDGRTLDLLSADIEPFDLILYSPPYLNNLDYSEVYKMELWLSEFVHSQNEFRELRSKTMRSHPSFKFENTTLVDQLSKKSWPRRLRDSILEVLPSDTYKEARRRTIRGYMDDMFVALQNQFRVVKPGGFVVCVVGNSLHGNKDHPIPISTDLLISSLATTVGFQITKVQATRHTNRRKHVAAASRESAIILRRPHKRA